MKCYRLSTTALLFALILAVGCDRTVPPPTPLTVEELPSAFEKAFAKAKAEEKDMAASVVSCVKTQDYSRAFFTLQNLSARPGLTKEQLKVTGRGTLTINSLLQEAQAKGDVRAAEATKYYRENK